MKTRLALLAAGLMLMLTATSPAAEPVFVDLAPVANTSPVSDGKQGWSNEGINDLFVYPPIPTGEVTRNGYRFKLIDPQSNSGNSVIMLKGAALRDKPAKVSVPVASAKGGYLYFLQAAVRSVKGEPKNYRVAVYDVTYSDGTRESIPLHEGQEIRHWWTGQWHDNSGEKSWPIFMGRNVYSSKWNQYVGIWAMQWANPHPQKTITAITLNSEGKAAPVILAITISDEDYYRSPRVKDDFKRPDGVPADYFAPRLEKEQAQIYALLQASGMASGVRRVEVIRDDLIAVTLDTAIARGAGPGADRAAKFAAGGQYSVSSTDDPAYANATAPQRVGRFSYEYWNGDVGAFKQNVYYWHTYYLALPKPLTSGRTYAVSVAGLEPAMRSNETFKFDEQNQISPAIKVNQVGYSSRATQRFAYLGWWAGDAGKVDFNGLGMFRVIDEATGQQALEGPITARKADDALSGEDVYQMDLSSLGTGRYHIVVPKVGRSESFAVGGAAMRELYYHTGRAFFHQRCGVALLSANTDFPRPVCHTHVTESGYVVGGEHAPANTAEPKRAFSGGYHDAADFDVFTYHLRATAQVLTAYEYASARLKDNDLQLPESGNGIPDVLDEADWALAGHRAVQQEDGGIPLGRGNDEDFIRAWERKHGGKRPPFGLLPPEPTSCTEYAAVAAQFSRLIRPYDAKRADDYLQSAKRAFDWPARNPATAEVNRAKDLLAAWAAAELYSAAGEETYNDAFKKLYNDGFLKNLHWSLQQTAPIGIWAYVVCKQPGVDVKIQAALRSNLIERANNVVKQNELAPYRVGRGPADKGNGWGNLNGGGHHADPCLRAYFLTGEQKYLDAASINADFQLGANPLGKTFITGMGARPPVHPQISPLLYRGPGKTGQTVKGITIYGIASGDLNWHPAALPAWRRWRDLGNGSAEISSEFTITETIGASAMLYSTLYALEP